MVWADVLWMRGQWQRTRATYAESPAKPFVSQRVSEVGAGALRQKGELREGGGNEKIQPLWNDETQRMEFQYAVLCLSHSRIAAHPPPHKQNLCPLPRHSRMRVALLLSQADYTSEMVTN